MTGPAPLIRLCLVAASARCHSAIIRLPRQSGKVCNDRQLTAAKNRPNINMKYQNSQQKSGAVQNVSRVSSPKRLRRQLYFSRTELSHILAAYSARVAAGEWRDYALDHMNGVALFSIFRHTQESPLFVIEKKQRHPKEKPQFLLRDRSRVLCQSSNVADITGHFNKLPRLISG
jgi:hypothetical protein